MYILLDVFANLTVLLRILNLLVCVQNLKIVWIDKAYSSNKETYFVIYTIRWYSSNGPILINLISFWIFKIKLYRSYWRVIYINRWHTLLKKKQNANDISLSVFVIVIFLFLYTCVSYRRVLAACLGCGHMCSVVTCADNGHVPCAEYVSSMLFEKNSDTLYFNEISIQFLNVSCDN